MTAIIREDAEPLAMSGPASVPAPFRWIVERLLHKEPAERYDSTRDLYRELRQVRERLSESVSASAIPASETAPVAVPKRRMLSWIGLTALLALGALLAAALIYSSLHPSAADLSACKFTAISRDEATERSPVWSPDGKSVACTASIHGICQVFSKVQGAPDTAQLTHASFSCTSPFWSPDGANIFYTRQGDLWSVGSSGGKPELALEKASVAAIHPDGKTIVFVRDGKTWVAPLTLVAPLKTGAPRKFASAPHSGAVQEVSSMKFSPDGSQLAVILNQSELWVQAWPLGAPRDFGVARDVSWLPDSRRAVVNASEGSLTVVDTTDGSRRVIYKSTGTILNPAVSPDGKKIACSAGATDWDVVEVSVPEGRAQTLVGGGEICLYPDWAPSGTHFLFNRIDVGAGSAIDDRSAAEGFSRRVAESPRGHPILNGPRWAPDGTRFVFAQGVATQNRKSRLTIANSSGGRWTELVDGLGFDLAYAWSPDGEWVAVQRREGDKSQLVKMKPVAGATPLVLGKASPVTRETEIQWSPTGEWIAYPSGEGISMISPDGNTVRKLTARQLTAFAFSKDGAQVYGIYRNTTGDGAQWQLYSVDVKTGAEKMLAPIDLPPSTEKVGGFSLHPDGKRFLTSIAKWPFDIWMLEGWDQPEQRTWTDKLLHR